MWLKFGEFSVYGEFSNNVVKFGEFSAIAFVEPRWATCLASSRDSRHYAPLPWPKAKAHRMTPLQQQKKREAARLGRRPKHVLIYTKKKRPPALALAPLLINS